MIYLFIIILLLFLIYIYDYGKAQKGRFLFYILTLTLLILVVGLRYRIGTDSIRYEIYFRNYPDLFSVTPEVFRSSRFSPLYILLNVIVRTFTDQFYVFQLVHATIVNTVIFYFFYKNCRHIFMAVLLYCLFLYLNLNTEVLREALAVCVFLLAWPAYKKNNWIVWYACSVIAFLFHVSAIFMFFIPLICLPGVRSLFIYGKRTIFICAVLFIIAGVFNVLFFRYLQSLALLENVAERATVYSKTDLAGAKLNIRGIIGLFFIFVFYPMMALYAIKRKRREEGKNYMVFDKLESLTILSIYVSILCTGVFIFQRFQNYLLFFPFIMISDYVFTRMILPGKTVKVGFVSWLLFLMPMFFMEFYTTYPRKVNQSGTLKRYMTYYPYSSVLDARKDENREKVFKYNHTR